MSKQSIFYKITRRISYLFVFPVERCYSVAAGRVMLGRLCKKTPAPEFPSHITQVLQVLVHIHFTYKHENSLASGVIMCPIRNQPI